MKPDDHYCFRQKISREDWQHGAAGEEAVIMEDMEKNEMIERLVQKTGISRKEAEELLERNNWDILDCMIELERTGRIHDAGAENGGSGYSTQDRDTEEFQQVTVTASRTREESTGAKLKRILKKLFRKSIDNEFIVSRKGREILHVPVLVPIIILLAAFWPTVVILLIGLLTGFRYSFQGKDLGTETVNQTMDRMADCAEDIKVKVMEFIDDEDTDSRR